MTLHSSRNGPDTTVVVRAYTFLLPNGTQVQSSFDVSTPMMDVLVRVTTSNGLSPAGMVLQAPTDRRPENIQYKPNVPISVLGRNVTSLRVVEKFVDRPAAKPRKIVDQLEQSLRVQIDLPGRRKTVLRVYPSTPLSDILHRVCEEFDLGSPDAYEIHGAKSGHGCPLRLDLELRHVGTVDFAVVLKPNMVPPSKSFHQYCVSNRREADQGCFRSLFKRKKRREQKVTRTDWNVPSSAHPEAKEDDSLPVPGSSGCDVPNEPTPPPPDVPFLSSIPPAPRSSRRRSGRQAPQPPPDQSTPCHKDSSERSDLSSMASSVKDYSASRSMDCLHTGPSESHATLVSNQSVSSRPESTRSDVIKKRRAPPPPIEVDIHDRTPLSLVKPQPCTSLPMNGNYYL